MTIHTPMDGVLSHLEFPNDLAEKVQLHVPYLIGEVPGNVRIWIAITVRSQVAINHIHTPIIDRLRKRT